MIRLLQATPASTAEKVPTDGQPGVFATLDAGAPKTVGVYFMYDVKQVDPAEWSSPPWDAALVDKPGLGKVMMGRGAVNQKGPRGRLARGAPRDPRRRAASCRSTWSSSPRARRRSVRRTSTRSSARPEVQAALAKLQRRLHALGVPGPRRRRHGHARRQGDHRAASSSRRGEKWGRGPRKDIHSSNKARVDSPAWHLVQALATLVTAGRQQPAIEGVRRRGAAPLGRARRR